MSHATAPVLTPDAITITTDHSGIPYAIVPDDIARLLRADSNAGIDPEARGIFFESTPHPALSWTAITVRTIFDAVLASPIAAEDDHAHGLSQYAKWDGGAFYGNIVGISAWDADARWWRSYGQHNDLIVSGFANIAHSTRGPLAGTCTFTL
ncbi:hypothetical protein ABZV52_30090 [Streptomyces sp. NPDC004735]|uniref:hypothetical protein n=1 Tax=Streptomyces sp. NPDC004735 TaxID=3156654 RepID=UPI0033A6A652